MQAPPENLQLLNQEDNNIQRVQAIVKKIIISVELMKDHFYNKDLGHKLSAENTILDLLKYLQR